MVVRFVHYCNSVSPHQLPLARELVRWLGAENYRYVATNRLSVGRLACGWSEASEPWISYGKYDKDAVFDAELENCEVLLTGIRELNLFETRAKKGLKTLYMSERWFKPVEVGIGDWGLGISLPGIVRMLAPSYRRMAKRFVRWISNDPNGRVLAIGLWAKKDMLRLGIPESKIVPWGYFVASSDHESNHHCRSLSSTSTLKILWVGRMVPLKRVDTIIRALGEIVNHHRQPQPSTSTYPYSLTLVGDGPEKKRLVKMAEGLPINFLPSQPIEKIRSIMRDHDVFVFASNGRDGWGAVVSEALEEGLKVIGTFETGASATMLSSEWLFHSGDSARLADLLLKCAEAKRNGSLRGQGIGEWSAARAAKRLLTL